MANRVPRDEPRRRRVDSDPARADPQHLAQSEGGRLSRKLSLSFEAYPAGQGAPLRGRALAAAKGFDVRVVTLPRGQDPADAPDGFAERLDTAESYLLYRVRL